MTATARTLARLALVLPILWLLATTLAPLAILGEASTRTWWIGEPAAHTEISVLRAERHRLSREWERAPDGPARYVLGLELRAVEAQERALQPRLDRPIPARGLTVWKSLVGPAGVALLDAAGRALAVSFAAIGLALLVDAAIEALTSGRRTVALVVLLAPLGLPIALRAAAVGSAAQGLDLTATRLLAEVLDGLSLALAVTRLARLAIDPAAVAAARDLGAGPLRLWRAVVLPRLALGLGTVAVCLFARSLGGLLLPAALGAADGDDLFAVLLRRRAVATWDEPTTAAWALAAVAVTTAVALVVALPLRRAITRRPPAAATFAIDPPRPAAAGRSRSAPVVVALAVAGVASLVWVPLLGAAGTGALRTALGLLAGRPIADLGPTHLEALAHELGRAALAAAAATLIAAGLALFASTRTRREAGRLTLLLALPLLLPPLVVGLVLRIALLDAGLYGDFGTTARTIVAFVGPWLLLALHLGARGDAVDRGIATLGRGGLVATLRHRVHRLRGMLPLGLTLAFVLALTAADAETVLGRPVFDPLAELGPDPAIGLALAVALAVGLFLARVGAGRDSSREERRKTTLAQSVAGRIGLSSAAPARSGFDP